MGLDGKVALVTGASGGMGYHFAKGLALEGARVAIHYHRNADQAGKLKEELTAGGHDVMTVRADIGQEKELNEMVDNVTASFGPVDILVNNAGISLDGLTWKMDKTAWDNVISVNLTGAFLCSKVVLPAMRDKRWGRIINITSVVGQMGVPGTPSYAASKSGLIGFTKTLAKEVITRGVTVNCLALGYFDAGMFHQLSEEIQQHILSLIPMKRQGDPAEAVHALLFLCHDHAGYVTGQVINVNGGIYV
jgi:3-oxoacyl-[acyl-carrier protein] reductase